MELETKVQRSKWLTDMPNSQKIKKIGRLLKLENAGNEPKK